MKVNVSLLFYFSWLILNFIQAIFTPIQADEAYYWLWSKQLAWGYFDHPSMVALIISMGTLFTKGVLGVRLGFILLFTAAVYVGENFLKKQDLKLYYLLIFSSAIFHWLGFMALPDVPLFLFSLLFFKAYQLFNEKKNVKHVLFLGFTMAMMMWSKYHGILIIAFTLFSNWKLLINRNFYFAALFTLVLFLPHLLWQYNYQFPTINYHFLHRSVTGFEWQYVFNFISSQLLLLFLFTGWLLLIVVTHQRVETPLDRALKWNVFGILIFFVFMSFRGHVEPTGL